MFKISPFKHTCSLALIVYSLLLTNSSSATDVRDKLIVKAYDCSDFAIDTTITRSLLPFEIPVRLGPVPGAHNYSLAPIVGAGQGGGLFGVPSRQGLRGGGRGSGGGGFGGSPPPPNTQSRPPKTLEEQSKITYQTKDLTEITNLIYEMVDPKSWSEQHARPKIRKTGSILVIRQTQKNHDEIQKLLNMLREARNKK